MHVLNDTASYTHHRHLVDDRVEVRLHINFLTSDTFIYHTTDEVQHLQPLYFSFRVCLFPAGSQTVFSCIQSGQCSLSVKISSNCYNYLSLDFCCP